MSSRWVTAGVVMGGLALAGAGLDPLATCLEPNTSSETPGQALSSLLLGGFRAPAADWAWLEASEAVQARNLPAAESWLRLVTTFDPRPLYFWINGARILAYDLPALRIAAVGGALHMPAAAQERWIREQAERALRWLDEAKRFHPASAALWIERASLQFNRLGDAAGAAESYRQAWAQPGAPYFAARLHAEMLRRLGRKQEALAWLVQLHPRLPPGDESAGADLVLGRIRALERELSVPPERRYRPM